MRLPLAAGERKGRGGAYRGRIERVASGSQKRTLRDGEGERIVPSVANVVMEESLTVPFPANCWISQRIWANCFVVKFSVGDALTNTDNSASRAPSTASAKDLGFFAKTWPLMAGFEPFRRANIRVESVNSMRLPKFLILLAYSSTVSVCICCLVNISLADCHFRIAGWINFSANAALSLRKCLFALLAGIRTNPSPSTQA